MVKGTLNDKSEVFDNKIASISGKKVRCYKCREFKSESVNGVCRKFGWLIDLSLARHQRLCHFG